MKIYLLGITLAAALTTSLQAYPVGNASFESDGTGTSYPNNGSPDPNATSGSGHYYEQYVNNVTNNTSILGPDWALTDGNAGGWNLIEVDPTQTTTTYNNRFLTAGSSDGSKYAFLNLSGPATITSTTAGLNLTIQPLTTYTLTIAIGNPTMNDSFGNPSPSEFIQFLANGSVLNNALFPLAHTNVSTALNSTFTDYTATFTTGTTDVGNIFNDTLGIQMGASGGSSNIGAFDNVRLDVATAPEPSSWALLLASAAGLFVFARRRCAR